MSELAWIAIAAIATALAAITSIIVSLLKNAQWKGIVETRIQGNETWIKEVKEENDKHRERIYPHIEARIESGISPVIAVLNEIKSDLKELSSEIREVAIIKAAQEGFRKGVDLND